MGGVTTLVGTLDGYKDAAVMVNGLNDWPFGPAFYGADAYDQIEAFLAWMGRLQFMSKAEEIGLGPSDLPSPLNQHPEDPRSWPDSGLDKLVRWWKEQHLTEDGYLKEETT